MQTEANTSTQELENIPATGFITTNNETTKERRMVEFNTKGNFQLSVFSIEQLLGGQAAIKLEAYGSQATLITVLRKLAALAIGHSYPETTGYVGVELEYKEVVQLRRFIEARMAHCEKELNTYEGEVRTWEENVLRTMNEYDYSREKAEAQFEHQKPHTNYRATTYVAQKNLLLELRLWLAGEIVD